MLARCSRSLASQAAAAPVPLRSQKCSRRSRQHSARLSTQAQAQPDASPAPTSGSGEPTLQIEFRGRKLQAPRGATLRTALLEAGVTPHNGNATLINCRGLGTCGTCAVEVQGPVEPQGWTPQERLRLNFPPHSPPGNQRLRLACQVACQGDLRVIKRSQFWGEGEEVLPDLDDSAAGQGGTGGVTPFGELEFVLDRRRPRKQ